MRGLQTRASECVAGDMALLEQVKQLIPRLTYQNIQDNPFAHGATDDVSEDAQDIVPLVIDAIVNFCHTQLCDFTAAFQHGTRMMKGAVEVMRIGLHSRGDTTGIALVNAADLPISSVSSDTYTRMAAEDALESTFQTTYHSIKSGMCSIWKAGM